jgi:hypothetical protein
MLLTVKRDETMRRIMDTRDPLFVRCAIENGEKINKAQYVALLNPYAPDILRLIRDARLPCLAKKARIFWRDVTGKMENEEDMLDFLSRCRKGRYWEVTAIPRESVAIEWRVAEARSVRGKEGRDKVFQNGLTAAWAETECIPSCNGHHAILHTLRYISFVMAREKRKGLVEKDSMGHANCVIQPSVRQMQHAFVMT